MSKSDGTFYRSKTFHVVERVRARVPLEIYWRPPEEAFPPVKNHWCSNTRLHSFKISAGLRCFIWTILPKQHALRQGRTEVRWPPGQDTSLAPHVRTWGLSGAMCCTDESTCGIAGTFRRPGHYALLPPLATPLHWDAESDRDIWTKRQVFVCAEKWFRCLCLAIQDSRQLLWASEGFFLGGGQ